MGSILPIRKAERRTPGRGLRRIPNAKEEGRKLPKKVMLRELGPRDGLQNEAILIPALTKLRLIQSLVEAGHRYIEATAFVSPKAVPQLADAEEVASQLPRSKNVVYAAVVPNRKGMERAIATRIHEVAVFTAASETFTRRNNNASIAESFNRFREVFLLARKEGITVRGYISTCYVCPYEGPIKTSKVVDIANRLLDMGCYEVSIGDTIGRATPTRVWRLFEKLLKKAPAEAFAAHFHDTYGTALANVMAAMQFGISTFDSSVGGLGGCPYTPGASGNVATEDLVYALQDMGIETGISLERLVRASHDLERFLPHPITSKVYQAMKAQIPMTARNPDTSAHLMPISGESE